MRGAPTLWALPFLLLVTSSALADVPNDPCMGATAGDSCTTLNGQEGSCVDVNGFLACEEAPATGSGGSTPTTSGAGAGGDGGDAGDAGSGDGDDGGCSVSTVGATTTGSACLLVLLGLAIARRRRR